MRVSLKQLQTQIHRHLKIYFVAFILLLTSFACSFPTAETETPAPTAEQEFIPTATATSPARPTATPQTLPPVLVESDPLPNSEISTDAELVLYFNQPMNPSSVEAALSGASGTFDWIDDSTVIFSPELSLPPGSKVNLQIDTQAEAVNGLSLVEPVHLEYQTTGFLRLAQNLPEDGTVAVDPTTAIVATFNRPVVALGQEEGPFPTALTLEPAAAGRSEWLNTSTYVFYPAPALAGGEEYTVRINENLTGIDGSPLQGRSSWSFTTSQPRLLSVEPVDGSRNINLDAGIRLTFNHPMNADGIAENFNMLDAEGGHLSGVFTWNELKTEFVFTPDHLLKRDQVYLATLGEETPSAGGTPLGSGHESEFRTIPELAVISSEPENNGQKEVYSSVAINFNGPVKAKDVLNFITLHPPVPELDAVLEEDGRTIWFSGYYAPETTYTLILSPNLPDRWNGRLGQEYMLNFRTKPVDPSLLVATGSDIVFLTPGESSISVQITNIESLSYSVGPLPFEDFQELVAPGGYEVRQTYRPERERTVVLSMDIPANQSTPVKLPLSVDGGPLDPGLYALRFNLDVDYIYPGPYLLVVSDINTTLKLSATDALVWAVNLQSGEMVSGVPTTIYVENGDALLQGITDSQGVLQADIPIRPLDDIYGVSYAILGEPGQENFSAALSSWGQGINGSSFGYQVDYSPPHLEAYLYTDRPIYQPGQTVHFRAVVRQAYNGRYSMPDQLNFMLNLVNDFGEQIATLDLPLSVFGTANGLYRLPEDMEPGFYRLTSEEAHFSSVVFQVADYRKPEIDLNVSFPKEQASAGERVNAEVSTRFFFDAPAGNIPVEWHLYRALEGFYLPGYQVGKFDAHWMSGMSSFFAFGAIEQVAQGEGKTNQIGIMSIGISLPAGDERYRYILEATAKDESELPVSARAEMLVNPAEFFIGVKPDAMSGRAGTEIGFEIQLVDWDQNQAGEHSLTAEFQHVVWEMVEPQPGDLRALRSYEPRYTPIGGTDFTTGNDGKARLAFTPPDPGTYQLEVRGADRESEGAITQILLWVGGPGQAVWPNLPNQRLRLTSDQESYAPGETARVFVPNPFDEAVLALVTIERGTLFEHQILEPAGSGFEISVPLEDEQTPNVYLSVTLLKPNEEGDFDFRHGYVNLPVEAVEQILTVSMINEPERTEPGGELTMDILVTDAEGQPVEGEFSLAVVDLATLALADPNSEEIVSAFYSDQPLGVSTSLSLAASTRLRTFDTEGIGGGGGGEPAAALRIREDFLDTAYWNAAILTDANGQARVSISLPDNVTTWQIDARGVTPETHVGQVKSFAVSTKDLLIRPVTPRFLVLGDHALLAAIVHNNTPDELEVDVSFEANGFNLDDPRSAVQSLTIPPGDRQRLEWWGTVQDVESVDLLFAASSGELQDASRPTGGTLPVLSFTSPQTFGTSGMMEAGGERLEVVSLPRSFDSQGGELSLEMAPTLGATMMTALEALENPRYANTEQLVSSFLPNVQTYQTIQEFGLEDPGLGTRLEGLLEDALTQLMVHQNQDGGWGWWKSGESDPYMTAYVVFGLLKAQEAGVVVEPGITSAALDYLYASLLPPEMLAETWQFDRSAFIHFVLSQAGAGDISAVSRLYEEHSRLNPWGQALLALAMESLNPGDERIQTLYSNLASGAVRSASGAHWENQEESWLNMSTTIQSSAVVLYALANHDPASPLVADGVRFLISHRNAQGSWASSYETAWTLMALSEVMKSTGELSGDYEYSAQVNDIPMIAGEASGTSLFTPVEAKVPINTLYADDPNSLWFSRGEGMGRLYYNAHLHLSRPVEDVAPLDRGINISRAYYSALEECSPRDCQEIQSASPGETVVVRLTLTVPETLYYLLVEDFIPAGAEILDVSLKTSAQGDGAPQFSPQEAFAEGWGWWYFTDPQIHDDRISWSVDVLPAGTYELSYHLVPLVPGEYRVLPANARQLYFPEVQGNSAGDIFEIKK